MNIQKINSTTNNVKTNTVKFAGHAKKMGDQGEIKHSFYYLYDKDKYNCYVELYEIQFEKDHQGKINGNIVLKGDKPYKEQPLTNGKAEITVPKAYDEDYYETIDEKEPLGFAYRFRLEDKKTGAKNFAFDNGAVIGLSKVVKDGKNVKIGEDKKSDNKFNVVFTNRAIINKNGPMQLIMPDEYFPGFVKTEGISESEALKAQALAEQYAIKKGEPTKRDKLLESVRTHATKLGGTFDGIIARLPEIKNEGISRIVGMPFTKDTVSSHLYWTENSYQIAPTLGNEEDFKNLQRELFSKGINWIADAALVNEGLNGVHLDSVLRKGKNSCYYNMFNINGDIKLGVIPKETEDIKKYTKMKIINSPVTVDDKGRIVGPDYDPITNMSNFYNPDQPTYVQFYDSRLADKSQIESTYVGDLKTYNKKGTGNVFDITQHDDAIYPFAFEVDPEKIEKQLRKTMSQEKYLDSYSLEDGIREENVHQDKNIVLTNIPYSAIEQIMDFDNFKIVQKEKAGGPEFWDGNVDIAKLNFFLDYNEDTEEGKNKERASLAVRDYAINSGRYWTQLTTDTQQEFIVDEMKKFRENNKNIGNDSTSYALMIEKLTEQEKFPKNDIDKEIVENVLKGDYALRKLNVADMRSYEQDEDNPEYNQYTKDDYIMKKAIDLPLETLKLSNNLMGVLTSPYIVRRPIEEEELGYSKFDLMKKREVYPDQKYQETTKKMDNIYRKQIIPLIKDYLAGNGQHPGAFPDLKVENKGNEDLTDEERYKFSEIVPDLTKYIITQALIESINKDKTIIGSSVKITEKGNFDFSNVYDEELTIQALGIPYDLAEHGLTEEDEANLLLDKLSEGIKILRKKTVNPEAKKGKHKDNTDKNSELADTYSDICGKMRNRFAGKTLEDYKIAEMIHDRTESGLGWRIDATKDVASIDSIREGTLNLSSAWDNVISFWKTFNQTVLKENPHAYTTAEVTDLSGLFGSKFDKDTAGGKNISSEYHQGTKYMLDGEAERKFLEQTGITCVANYSFFFSGLPSLFTPFDFEYGKNFQSNVDLIRNKLTGGWDRGGVPNVPGFLYQSPEDGVVNSYTFVGNHDKPRILHCLALDMSLFLDENFEKDEHKKAVYKLLGDGYDYDTLSSKAVAMATRLNQAIDSVEFDSDSKKNESLKKDFKDAIKRLCIGVHKGKNYGDKEAFGTRPFDVAIDTVIQEVNYKKEPSNGINHHPSEKAKIDKIKAKLLENIMQPAMDRYLSIYKMLVTLPGSPTDFAGDRVGESGFESKSKNYHQQNRNIIHWEHLTDENYKFVQTFYSKMNDIAKLRANPKLSALNDGATVMLPVKTQVHKKEEAGEKDGKKVYDNDKSKSEVQLSKQLQAVLRYNDKGSVVLCLYNNKGVDTDRTSQKMDRNLALVGEDAQKAKEAIEKNNNDSSKKYIKSAVDINETDKDGKDIIKTYENGSISSVDDSIFDKIILGPADDIKTSELATVKEGLNFGLNVGTVFKDLNDKSDMSEYKIEKRELEDQNHLKRNYYCLVKRNKNTKQELPIIIKPEDLNTMILYANNPMGMNSNKN